MERKFKKAKRYTFFNNGTGYEFKPEKNASHNGELSNLLEIHKDLVRFYNDPSVFILDDAGNVLT